VSSIPKVMPPPAPGRADHKPHVVGGYLWVDSHVEFAPVFAEFPAIGCAVWRWSPADAPMRGELRRMLRLAEAFDVGWGGEGAPTLIARDRNSDHVLVDDLAQTYTRIIAFRDNVKFLVRDGHVDLN